MNRCIAVTAISALAAALSHNAIAQQANANKDYKYNGYENRGYHGGSYDNRGDYDNYNYDRRRSGKYDSGNYHRGRSGMGSGMGMGSGSGYSNRGYGYDRDYRRMPPPAYRPAYRYEAPRGGHYAPGYRAQVQAQSRDRVTAEQPAATSGVDVRIAGMQFSPAPLKIKPGEEIVWQNADGMPHTVTSNDGGPLDSGQLGRGDTYSFTFTEPGTYEYYCTYHPSMTGTVIVE